MSRPQSRSERIGSPGGPSIRRPQSRGRRRRRRVARGTESLTLDRLLFRQPKSLSKHPEFKLMQSHYRSSERLRTLRISRRCYRLLDRAMISPENLHHFHRTYRLPRDPFFPLFLTVKRDYLKEREEVARQREAYILKQVKTLSPRRRQTLRFLAEWEESINRAHERPVWDKTVYPGSKKRADELTKLTVGGWLQLYDDVMESMGRRYPGIDSRLIQMIRSSLILELIPVIHPLHFPDRVEVARAYRRLCRTAHPDAGGRAEYFIRIKESRDFLLKEI